MMTGSMRSLLATLLLLCSVTGLRVNKKLTSRTGYISTPQYPNNYPDNTDAYWEFVRPDKDSTCVKFTVEDFELVSEDEIFCPGDSFVLESCGSWWNFAPERQYCGNYSSIIASRGPFNLFQFYDVNATSLRVSFHSDSSSSGAGFLMQYEILDKTECAKYGAPGATRLTTKSGDEIPCLILEDDPVGQIKTLGYPSPYPADIACVYAFKKPSPDYCGVFIETTKFDLEAKDLRGTCHDYFSKPGCVKFCGTQKSPDSMFFEYQPGSDIMSFQFEADFSSEGRGFLMNYLQLKECFNPHQPDCPNNKLSRGNPLDDDSPNECYKQVNHDCHANQQCDGGKICCFDGCYRRCVNPEVNVRKRRQAQIPSLPFQGSPGSSGIPSLPSLGSPGSSGIFRYPDQPKFWTKEQHNNKVKIIQNIDKWEESVNIPSNVEESVDITNIVVPEDQVN